MPLFYNLDGFGDDTSRVAGRLAAIRETMQHHPQEPDQRVPDKNATDTLLLATWNLKAFDGGTADQRTDESYWYIAEIVSHFDIIDIHEVGANLGALEKLAIDWAEPGIISSVMSRREKRVMMNVWRFYLTVARSGSAASPERL
jgi:hypothetical protein